MIQSNIYPRDEGFVAGSYLASQETKGKPEKKGGKRKLKKKDDVLTNNNDTQKDIRAFFNKSGRIPAEKKRFGESVKSKPSEIDLDL